MDASNSLYAPRLGRPTKEQSEARRDALLDIALDHFQEKGFEQATVEAITLAASMSKRTVYQLYPDKLSLFHAVVRRAVKRTGVSRSQLDAVKLEHLESTLLAVALLFFRDLMTPQGIKLQRLLHRESHRLSTIGHDLYDAKVPTFIAEQIRGHARPGSAAYEQPERAAEAFMSMALSAPRQVMMAGGHISQREIEQRILFGIRLFLEGVKAP